MAKRINKKAKIRSEPDGYEIFPNAPIQEAVFNVIIEHLPNEVLDRLKSIKFGDTYSETKSIQVFQKQFSINENTQQQSDSSWTQGFQFWENDKKQLFTCRLDGFSFNKLKPYETGKSAIKKTVEGWKIFKEAIPEAKIARVSVRNINVIEIPHAKFVLEDYFKFFPHVPAKHSKRETSNFVAQMVLKFPEDNAVSRISLMPVKRSTASAEILFDIEVSSDVVLPKNMNISKQFHTLNRVKDEVFFSCITPKCRALFR